MIEWLIENKNVIIGAAAVALPLAVIDWIVRNRKQKEMRQQKPSPDLKPRKKKAKKRA